ncbi:hypothetical protein ACPEEZ_08150 [Frigoribacterium sp. 2-23]|uniref:hypothetical protein n=1 Tax=Frigoribacterium sp. 2-23 TaxID=3415006 RepID=UPI003C6EE4AB
MNDIDRSTTQNPARLAGRYVGAPLEPSLQGVYTAASRPAVTPGSFVSAVAHGRSRVGRYTAMQWGRLLTATGTVRTLTGSIQTRPAR